MRKESDQIVVTDEGCLPAALVSRRAAPPSPGLALAPATNEAAPWCQTHRLTTASRPPLLEFLHPGTSLGLELSLLPVNSFLNPLLFGDCG